MRVLARCGRKLGDGRAGPGQPHWAEIPERIGELRRAVLSARQSGHGGASHARGGVFGIGRSDGPAEPAQVKWIGDLTKRHYSGSGPIGILGLTYKPDTDVVEESFGLLLAGEFTSANLPVVVYDPLAEESRVRAVNERVEFVGSAQECVEKSDVVVISTPWAQFHQIPRQSWSRHSPARTVIDCWRAFTGLNGVEGVRYVRLGFGEGVERAAETVSTD